MEESKPWWASKTLWANLIALAAAVGGTFGLGIIDEETSAALVGGVMAVVNIVLRIVTKGPVTPT